MEVVDFDKLNVKFVKRTWFPTSIENFASNLKRFYNFVIDLHCQNSDLKEVYEFNSKLDNKININGKVRTPDLVQYSNTGELIRIIDFKCSLYEVDAAEKETTEKTIKKKYGDLAEVVWIVADWNFLQKIKDKNQKAAYIKLLREIKYFRKLVPKNIDLDFIKAETSLPELDEILDKHPKIQAIKDDYNNLKHTMSEDQILTDILKHMREMETYTNNNALPTKDLPKSIPKSENATVYIKDPCNRDSNREEAEKNGLNYNWGHKANYIYQFPTTANLENCSAKELVGNIYSLCNDTHLADGILVMLRLKTEFASQVNAIKELLRIKAYLKGEAETKDIEKLAQQFDTKPSKLIKTIELEIGEKVRQLQVVVGKDIHISKHGNPKLKVSKEIKTGINVNPFVKQDNRVSLDELDNDLLKSSTFNKVPIKNSENSKYKTRSLKKEGRTVVEWDDWFQKQEDQHINLLDEFEPINLTAPSHINAYPFNESLNDLSNKMARGAEEKVNTVLQSKQFASVYNLVQAYRAIIMAAPRVETKGFYLNEMVLTQHPNGYWIITTPSPNELTSGCIITLGRLKKGCRLPNWSNKYRYIDTDECTYFLSDPFRVNMKIAANTDSVLGSYLGTTLFMQCYGADILNNALWGSLWWSYARQLALVADLIYLYYKNVYNVGSFGKFEIEKKFKKLEYRDVRVVAMMKRLKDSYLDLHDHFWNNKEGSPFNGAIDPIFKFKHTGWQTFLSVGYLKQVFPKGDGFDEAALMGGFFRDEMEFRSWYEESQFNEKNLDYKEDLDMDRFFEMLFKDHKTWENLSYHPNVCTMLMKRLLSQAREKDPGINPYRDWLKPAITTGKASKCNIPAEQTKLYGVDKKLSETAAQKARHKGIVPSYLTEALLLESSLFKRHVEEKFMMGDDNPWQNGKFKVGDKMVSMAELTLFEMYIYPECVVLTMVPKEQTGFDKRGFFVQLIYNRNANKMWDETFRPIVVTNKWDMILTPGMKKYLKFQREMKEMTNGTGKLLISKDATKFGDTYMIETLKLQIIQFVNDGYITKNEGKMLMVFAKCLQNRITLMPWQNVKLFNKREHQEILTDKEQKWALEMDKFSSYLNEPDKFSGFEEDNIMTELKDNPSFKKPVGFTLGVFNISGSLYTAAYTELIEMLENKLGIFNLFRASTHSDDAEDTVRTKCPDASMFKINNYAVSNLVEAILLDGRILTEVNGIFYLSGKTWDEPEIIKEEVISKLHIILTLFTPRFVSQRPSLLKWTWGVGNEVIQVVKYNNQVIVPMIRYAAAIGKDLPGKSPGSDTYMMSGRTYDLLVNGGTHDTVAAFNVLSNWLVSDMYGLHTTKRNILDPPEIGGLWWAIPGMIYEQGYNANEVRLQCIKDQHVKNTLAVMINVDTFWRKEKHENKFKDLFVAESLDLDDAESNITGGIEYRRDFMIRFNRKKKTSLAMEKLLTAFKTEIDEAFNKIAKDTKSFKVTDDSITTREKMLILKDRWVVETNVGSKSFIQRAVSNIGRYTSTSMQDSYARLSQDTRLIQKLGYLSRKISSPFSELWENWLNSVHNVDVTNLTIEEVWRCVHLIADYEALVIPEINLKGINIIRKILGNLIAETNNLFINIGFMMENQDVDLVNTEYMQVNDKRDTFGIGTNAMKAVAVVYEIEKSKNQLSIKDTFVVKSNPELFENRYFYEQIQLMKSFLQGLGFTALDIKNHFRLLIRLLSEKTFYGIAKTPSAEFRFEKTTGMLWSYNKRLIITSTYKPIVTNIEIEENTRLNVDLIRFDRIIGAIAWGSVIMQNLPLDGEITYAGHKFNIPKPEFILEKVYKDGFSVFRANQLMASMIYHYNNNNRNPIVSRTKMGKDYLLAFALPDTEIVYFHGYPRDLENNNTKYGWEIFTKRVITERNLGFALFRLGQLVTYWLVSRNKRLNSLDDIVNRNNKVTNFALFGNNITYEDKGSDNYTNLDIYLHIPQIIKDANMVYGKITAVGIEFEYKKFNKKRSGYQYLATMWDFGNDSSGLIYTKDGSMLLKDARDFTICGKHTEYITYNCGLFHLSELIKNVDSRLVVVSVELALEVCKALANAVNFNVDEYTFVPDDHSEICSRIRTMEIYLGCPISLVIYNIEFNAKKKKNMNVQITTWINNCLEDCDFSEIGPLGLLRAIGYINLCENRLDEDYDFIYRNFMKTTPQDSLDLLHWTREDKILQGMSFPVDIELRWKRSGNMPISVLRIILSSVSTLYKMASFLRRDNNMMYRKHAIDEIYFQNAINCSGSIEVLKLIDFIGFV